MKTLSLSALLAAGVLAGGISTASAADLGVGGNCCADLEERIAELEATTARKGNRKVSLTITGWVSQQVTFWDDGRTKNAYVGDPGDSLASHVTFTGEAKINSDWSAGYVLYIEAISNEAILLSQTADNANSKVVNVYQSYWFLKSNTLGKLGIGQQSGAADNAAFLVDGSGSSVPANYVLFDNNNFAMIRAGDPTNARTSTTWGQFASCGNLNGVGLGADCEGIPANNVRYDTPTFGGFSGSASWGENDAWALSGRYAGEFNSVKVAAAIAYFDTNDNSIGVIGITNPQVTPAGLFRREAGALQMAGYVQHVPTGLFFYAAYAKDYNDSLLTPIEVAANGKKTDGDNFYLKAGIRQKWSGLGHTVLFGEYGENNDKQSVALWNNGVSSSNLTQWGLGVVQEIDAAAMQTWFVYRNFSADQTCRAGAADVNCLAGAPLGGKVGFKDIDVFKVGGLIAF